jgi:predicted ATPase/DNA-binding winged helix-turn-helix (wHTH) protein
MSWVPLAGGGADLERQRVVFGETAVKLTTKERDLVAYLSARPGTTVTRGELLVEVWKQSTRASEEPVYSAIKRLRAKIDRGEHQHVVSVHGDGYRWVPPVTSPFLAFVAAGPAEPIARRAPRDAFFGREAERAAASEALDAPRTIVTLVGPGGVGKTRLAMEIAASRAHVFCDLSSALDEGAAIARIAASLEVPLAGIDQAAFPRAIRHALASHPERLVILDNAEQLLEPVATLLASWADVLPSTLVTSREPLRLQGERVVAVGPLPLSEAVALFGDRVAASGGERVEAATSEAIVARVDRLPLAIELAAALVPSIGAATLLASLVDSLGTLVDGRRDAPARHATLRAAVEWSWAYLDAAERDGLADLATFEGSFDVEAARAVIARDDAPALLATLCRRSQVHREGDRFRLYAAVRELARERGERDGADLRHAAYFVERGAERLAMREGPRHAEASAWLDRTASELRVAFERSLAGGWSGVAILARCVDAAQGQRGGDVDARRASLRRAIEATRDAGERAALLLAEGLLPGSPIDVLEQALALADSEAARAEIGLALGRRHAPHDALAAREMLGRALQHAVTAGDERSRGRIIASLGETAWLTGAVDEARGLLREGLVIHERARDDRAIAGTAALLAHLDRLESGDGAASELLRRATESASRLADPLVAAQVALDRGQHLTRVGDQRGARVALDEAMRAYARIGFVRERALAHLHLTEALVGVGDLDAALEEAQRALADLDDADVACSTVHEAIACVHLLAGRGAEAARWIESGLALARARGAARSECTLLGKRGLFHLSQGDAEQALSDFDAAARKNEARGSTAITGASLVDRAMAARAAGRDVEADADLARARTLLREPDEARPEGRMLVVCDAAGRGFAAVAAGASPSETERRLRAETARFFERVPQNEWDLVLRFLDWLVGRVGRMPARRRAAPRVRPTRGKTLRRSR